MPMDPEMLLCHQIARKLDGLPSDESRRRVLRYLAERYEETQARALATPAAAE